MLAPSTPRRQHYPLAAAYVFTLFFILAGLFNSSARAQSNGGKRNSTFTARLINIESAVKTPFRYNTSLYNGSGQTNIYELLVKAPDGWMADFRTDGSQVAAVRVEAGKTQNISVEIAASPSTRPGKYDIPVSAVSNGDTLRIDLEAVVKGSYDLQLTTPTGRLSDDVTEGSSKQLRLTIKNTGTLPLNDVALSAQSPTQWSTKFEPAKIERLDAGQSQEIEATLSVPDKTIAGDYVTNFTAKNSYTTADAAIRMTVKTSLLSGWIGIMVILLALATVYYLVRKYGRR